MPDRDDAIRKEAERCLALSFHTRNLKLRAELINLAARLRKLADHSPMIDFDAILQRFNAERAAGTSESRQQQQIRLPDRK
jgi:hypothetical protein